MKVHDIALLALVGITGCLIYTMGQRASSDESVPVQSVPQITPSLKPATKKGETARTSPQVSPKNLGANSVEGGTLRRLTLGQFKTKSAKAPQVVSVTQTPAPLRQNSASTPITEQQTKPRLGLAPRGVPSKLHPPKGGMTPPQIPQGVIMPVPETQEKMQPLTLGSQDHAALERIDLSTPVADPLLTRVVHMAEASPIQPGSRGCGTAVLDTPISANNVNSVGYKREITPRIGVGLEYVYKDGCYQNAITPLNSRDMPSDDGVSLRVNMRF